MGFWVLCFAACYGWCVCVWVFAIRCLVCCCWVEDSCLRSPCGLDTFLKFKFFNYADVKVTFYFSRPFSQESTTFLAIMCVRGVNEE